LKSEPDRLLKKGLRRPLTLDQRCVFGIMTEDTRPVGISVCVASSLFFVRLFFCPCHLLLMRINKTWPS
jgi:hypothetical protein